MSNTINLKIKSKYIEEYQDKYPLIQREILEDIEELKEDYSQEIKPLKVTGDAIKWKIFAKTKEKMQCTTDAEGFDNCRVC